MAAEFLKRIETALKQGKSVSVIYLPPDDEKWKCAWEILPGKTLIHFTNSGKVKCYKKHLIDVVRDWDPRWCNVDVYKKRTELEDDFDEFDDLF